MTPRPWLPSSGLSATGKPILPAAAAASSGERTTDARGTGTPVAARSWFVSFLSDAVSTAIELVLLVMVARMRCWWTPWPSWTSEALIQADPRDVAQRGLVDERLRRRAEGGPLGEQDERLQLGAEVESLLGADEMVDEPHRQACPAARPTALLTERVDDVVAPGLAGAARLAAADFGARLALELERDVLGHVAEPGAVAQAPGKAAGLPGAARVAADARAASRAAPRRSRGWCSWGTARARRGRRSA